MTGKSFNPDFEAIRLEVLDEYQATIPEKKRGEMHIIDYLIKREIASIGAKEMLIKYHEQLMKHLSQADSAS